MPVQYVKLTNDADVVADVEMTEGGNYKLTNPIRVVLHNQGVAMIPFCPFARDKSFIIDKSFVVTTGSPEEDLLNAYNQKFGGIVIAQAPAPQIILND